ncbi:MAG: toll/interleukin-1 receptor domain-containing protein [Cyanobium sp.]
MIAWQRGRDGWWGGGVGPRDPVPPPVTGWLPTLPRVSGFNPCQHACTIAIQPGVPQAVPERRHVFISYSHADRRWVERLKRSMAPLLRSGLSIRLWDDSQIEPGRQWREQIETALAQAKVALLLVSDHFLDSEFVMGEEVPRLLAAAKAEGVRVLWVSLTTCHVEQTEIYQYQAVLPPSRPLDKMARADANAALKEIGSAIQTAMHSLPNEAPIQWPVPEIWIHPGRRY